MDVFMVPFMLSAVADRVVQFLFGIRHPNRLRTKIQKERNIVLGKQIRRGSGTESIMASIALPLLVADLDNRDSLADRLEHNLRRLRMETVFDRDIENASQSWKEDISRRFTVNLERFARKDKALSADKGRIVRMDETWALIAVGDPREDSYRLERMPAEGLRASGLDAVGKPFVRVIMHEQDRVPRPIYLAAWEQDDGPSPALFEMLMRAKPAKPLSKGDERFTPIRHRS